MLSSSWLAHLPPTANQLEEIAAVFAVIHVDGDVDATDCGAAKAALRGMGFSIRKKEMVQVYGHTTTCFGSQNVPALRMSCPKGFGCFGD